jgi:hypothetical protein
MRHILCKLLVGFLLIGGPSFTHTVKRLSMSDENNSRCHVDIDLK